MELVTHYSRSFRRAYERSISDQKFENHQYLEKDLQKGHFQRRENENDFTFCHYQKENSSHDDDCRIKDLRVDKHSKHQEQRSNSNKIKQEQEASTMTPLSVRRYFCIFCKMDFSIADEFLDHIEMHPNGSFVLVKRDLPSPPLSPKIQQISHNNNNYNNHHHNHENNNINNNNNISHSNERFDPEEETLNLPIIPEMLKNQIKIEPISEDEEEEDHITINEQQPTQYNEANETNVNSPSPVENSSETSDPNHQLLVLSNPRFASDDPGQYLCNVCHAKFVYKNNLKSHLKRHLGIYPYVCFCGKRYQFKCKLNKHIEQAHAKIKNFKCPVPTCPKKYFTRNDLAFHISVTHQERQEIPCSICQKVFNSQKSLQIHCRKYHRNQES